MAFAGRVLDQHDFTGTNLARLTIARGQFHTGIEIDDVLPPRRRMPGPVVFRLGLPEDDAVGGLKSGSLAFRTFVHPLDRDIAPVRFTCGVAVQVVYPNAHLIDSASLACAFPRTPLVLRYSPRCRCFPAAPDTLCASQFAGVAHPGRDTTPASMPARPWASTPESGRPNVSRPPEPGLPARPRSRSRVRTPPAPERAGRSG